MPTDECLPEGRQGVLRECGSATGVGGRNAKAQVEWRYAVCQGVPVGNSVVMRWMAGRQWCQAMLPYLMPGAVGRWARMRCGAAPRGVRGGTCNAVVSRGFIHMLFQRPKTSAKARNRVYDKRSPPVILSGRVQRQAGLFAAVVRVNVAPMLDAHGETPPTILVIRRRLPQQMVVLGGGGGNNVQRRVSGSGSVCPKFCRAGTRGDSVMSITSPVASNQPN